MKNKLTLLILFFHLAYQSAAYDLKIMALDRHEYEVPGTYNSALLFQNLGTNNIQYFELKWSLNGTVIGTENVNILSSWASPLLPSDAFTSYYFPYTIQQSLALLSAGEYDFKLWINTVHGAVDDDQTNDTIAYRIHVVDYLPEKHVLLEEYTHTYCGPCYNGDLDLEELLAAHSQLSAVSIHNDVADPMSFSDGTALDTYFSTAHPNFVFDRYLFNPNTEYSSMIWSGGNSPDLTKRFNMKEGLEVSISEQNYDPASRLLTVTLRANFYANYEDALAWNVWVLEDSIFGYQASAPNPNNYYHNHVARSILGGIWGESMSTSTLDGTTAYHTFSYTLPSNFDENQIRVIGFVQRKDGERLELVNTSDDLKIQEHYVGLTAKSIQQCKVYPNPTAGMLEIETNAPIQRIIVVDLMGTKVMETSDKMIDLSPLTAGTYVFTILTESGVMREQVVKW